ncbi:MAG: YggS family pyridoxal phosphate-dependent enzyme [Schleiferiaceae bacterium]|nr:YggS family pyridoxal phosphate-dependent enzyme [Schleiferiaceae bacterium]
MSIASNLSSIKNKLPQNIELVAVSKTKPNEDILEAYQAGQRIFGENKIQEMASKYEALPKDIEWHMIGHVQTNKIKFMAPFVSLVHGVDREKVLKELNKQAQKNERIIKCLLQVHIAQEETKFGFDSGELDSVLNNRSEYTHVEIVGLMGMASNTDNEDQVRGEFKTLKTLFDTISERYGLDSFNTLSMGMSGDFSIAIEEGSTMIRVGSSIFGARNY